MEILFVDGNFGAIVATLQNWSGPEKFRNSGVRSAGY